MTSTYELKTSIAWAPAITGTALCIGAIALLTSDAITSGHITITHALQPLLVFGTVASAAMAHHRGWRKPVSAIMFLALALFGSVATVWGTMGRQADSRDMRHANVTADNRMLELKQEDLETAKADAKRECRSGFGPRCSNANARVDKLTTDLTSLRPVSEDPRADAIANLVHLVAGIEHDRTRAIVTAVDPLVLPLFLELGATLFFGSAFPRRKVLVSKPTTLPVSVEVLPTLSLQEPERVVKVFSRDEALADLRRMKESGSQRMLAERWGLSEATVSRWLQGWNADGAVNRHRDGKAIRSLIAAPERKRLGHMAKVD
jgi:hypothetical protein